MGGGDIKKPNSKVEAVEAPKFGCFHHRFWGSSWVLSLSPGEDQRGTMLEKKNMDVFEEGVYHWKSFSQKWPKVEGYTPNRVPSTQSWRNDDPLGWCIVWGMRDTWPFQWKMMMDHELDHQLRGARLVEINHDKPKKWLVNPHGLRCFSFPVSPLEPLEIPVHLLKTKSESRTCRALDSCQDAGMNWAMIYWMFFLV